MIIPQIQIEGSAHLFETTKMIDYLDQNNPLVIISKNVDWKDLEESFYKFYHEKKGRPIVPIQIMIGLLLLKYMFDLSDRDVIAQFQENIYYQAFCGKETFTKDAPCDPSQLSYFRKRIGNEGVEIIFAESVRINGSKALEKCCIADTTVQEKNITFPTDSKLILRAIKWILIIANFLSLPFRMNFKQELKNIKNQINFGKDKLHASKKEKLVTRL